MAQTGYTPIQLYRSATASAVPSSANLSAGELAIYRQALRDVPSQAGFPWDVQWPVEP